MPLNPNPPPPPRARVLKAPPSGRPTLRAWLSVLYLYWGGIR